MYRILILTSLFMLTLAVSGWAQHSADEEELIRLLTEFLQGASVNDASVHDRFWADDLVYTSSSGERFGKTHIMRNLETAPQYEAEDEEPPVIFHAEDIDVRLFGDAAVVAFRLVATSGDEDEGEVETANYFNTGTFIKREGKWQAVAWQATRIPE
jgi:ketosteroid isomerase-like protein